MLELQNTSKINGNFAPEYIIYTFEHSDVLPHRLHWKKQSVTTNKLSAYQAGQKLFSLKKYDRIELYERAYANDHRPESMKPIHRWQNRKCAFSMYNLFWIAGVIILLASFIVFHFH
jgi:hypothetical protein